MKYCFQTEYISEPEIIEILFEPLSSQNKYYFWLDRGLNLDFPQASLEDHP